MDPADFRALIGDNYDGLRRQLALKLGSEELALEALHEAWLRLRPNKDFGTIHNPAAYLFQTAVNIARDINRRENRIASRSEVIETLDFIDDSVDPAREAERSLEIEALKAAIAELPEPRRAILIASRFEESTYDEIAARFGISRRTVQNELARAFKACQEFMEKRRVKDAR